MAMRLFTGVLCLAALAAAIAQEPPTPPPSSAEPTTATTPPVETRPRQQQSVATRSVIVTGTVAVEGGGSLPADVVVQAVCNGSVQQVLETRGRFRIMLGWTRFGDGQSGQSIGTGALMGCEIRVSLSGYLSAYVMVDAADSAGGRDIGVIILRRAENVQGYTYSATSLLAPKEARAAYDRGMQRAGRKKLDEARKEFEAAIRLHPSYAAAWYELGAIHHQQQRIAEARRAYLEAEKADNKFLKPTLQLAMLASAERNWPEAVRLTDRVIQLNPYEFPQAFLYNAAANFNLERYEEAERSVRKGLELDGSHRFPKANLLLAELLARRQDLAGAAENLRAYLQYSPKAADAAEARQKLGELERRAVR
jgi:TolA-binding protein